MNDFDPTHRGFVSYIDKSREFYLARGYGNPYRWASFTDTPFRLPAEPLSECRVAAVTTAARSVEDAKSYTVYAAPGDSAPAALYTRHLSWHKQATHTDDVETFLPLGRLAEAAASGRIGSVSPRFYGVKTDYSARRTMQEYAPAILDWCREDGVDAALLVAL